MANKSINPKKQILTLLKKHISIKNIQLEIPPDPTLGDYSLPCFQLSNALKKPPNIIAPELAKNLKPNKYIRKITPNGPYLNFFINKNALAEKIIKEILKQKDKYGSKRKNNNKIVIDFSSPNIAKPFSIGHLRSTVIGNSLYKIYSFLGYKCIGINHLGDWGTQFGKLITAYKKWGDQKELKKSPIKHLLSLYVKFHQLAKEDDLLNDQARIWFKKLEKGDKEALKLWRLFKKLSLKEFNKLYKRLNITFDSYSGEAFYNTMLSNTVNLIKSKKIAKTSQGALIVEFKDLPPMLLVKSDGASLYGTRDIAAAIYRQKCYKPHKILYITGAEQTLHFKQFFKILKLMKFKWADNLFHVPFGMFRFDSKKMSTREGKVVFMEEVLNQSIARVEEVIKIKNPNLKNKQKIAEQVGIGAIIFFDLSHDRLRDIDFDWNKILDFEGETGPYVQYVHARANSILKKAAKHKLTANSTKQIKFNLLTEPEEFKLITLLQKFPETVEQSVESYKPSIIAKYSIELAQAFNEFYHKCQCINPKEKDLSKVRIELVRTTKQVIKNSLSLLGIQAPSQM